MKTRILSALVGLVLLGIVYIFLDTLVLNIAICLLCVAAVYELLRATRLWQYKSLSVVSILITVVIPLVRTLYMKMYLLEATYLLALVFFILLLKNNGKMGIEHFAMAFFFSTVIPVFFSCAVYIRDDYGPVVGGFYLFMALGAGWLCDSGAYFVGRKFGRHKLAPYISPKKTVEGAVGGVLSCTVCMLLIAWGFASFHSNAGMTVMVNYKAILLCTPIIAVVGMLGDLSASVIKRQFGVKDYGKIMPGHGGILDRFDSVLFTLPAMYVITSYVDLITVY